MISLIWEVVACRDLVPTACRGLEADHTVVARASVLALRSTSPATGVGSPFPAD